MLSYNNNIIIVLQARLVALNAWQESGFNCIKILKVFICQSPKYDHPTHCFEEQQQHELRSFTILLVSCQLSTEGSYMYTLCTVLPSESFPPIVYSWPPKDMLVVLVTGTSAIRTQYRSRSNFSSFLIIVSGWRVFSKTLREHTYVVVFSSPLISPPTRYRQWPQAAIEAFFLPLGSETAEHQTLYP